MKKLFAAAALAAALFMNTAASAGPMTGNLLLQECTSRSSIEYAHCGGYVLAHVDALIAWRLLDPDRAVVCFPDGLITRQLVDVSLEVAARESERAASGGAAVVNACVRCGVAVSAAAGSVRWVWLAAERQHAFQRLAPVGTPDPPPVSVSGLVTTQRFRERCGRAYDSMTGKRESPMLVDPRVFIEEYVTPAIELYRTNHLVKHLAVHAMTQVDVLAAAVLLWDVQGRPLKKGEENKFRNELGTREPTLALIRDAHDGHKHGALNRKTATAASKGQRPEQVTKSGWFYGHSFLDPDDPPIAYDALVFTRDDKTEEEIFPMLHNAMQAWERELGRRGL